MCGIYGEVAFKQNQNRLKKKQLEVLDRSMHHRGPDGNGSFSDGIVTMGMRRLSIIDVQGGNQPLFNEDKSIVIVGNGEIYNYKELNKRLVEKRHRLATGSDIETIVHLYEDQGAEAVNELRGMYAFCLYDIKKNLVLLARDKMGEKPLYWSRIKERIVFASELKSILKFEGIDKQLNYRGLDEYFHFYYIPEPQTGFANIHKLAAGQIMEINLKSGEAEMRRYWDASKIISSDNDDPAEKIREVFAESCRLALRSDVPVGISLSGGIDSGAILAFAAPAYKETMKAFSIGYEGTPPSDEREMARKLAKKFKVEFFEKEIKKNEVIDGFPKLVRDSDDPVADIAAFSIYSVSKLSRENKVPVMLGGLGGDELFWGYPWIQEATKETLQKKRVWKEAAKWKISLAKNNSLRLLTGRWKEVSRLAEEKNKVVFYDQNPGYKTAESIIKPLYGKKLRQTACKADGYMDFDLDSDELSLAHHSLDLIRDLWLVSNCIVLGDRLSMASSIELRSPFLDYKLVETVLGNKQCLKAYDRSAKYWFKRAMKGILPDEVMNRPKRGFTPPVAEWIRGILSKYLYLTEGGFLEKEMIISPLKMKLIRNTWLGTPMYWYAYYQLVLLEIWGREYYYNQSADEIKGDK